MEHKTGFFLCKAVALNLLAWLVFTCMTALSKNAQNSASVPMILLVQNAIGVLCTLPYMLRHSLKDHSKSQFSLIAFRSITGQLNIGCLFLAVRHISLANAMLLNNAAPVLVPLLSFLWLKSRIAWQIWPAIILGFIGVFCILQPTQQLIGPGAMYALIAAFFLALVMISLGLLAKEKSFVILFYFFLVGTIISLPLSFWCWKPIDGFTWIQLILIGILMIIGQYWLVLSFRYAKPSQLAPMSYSVVVYSLLLDWALWHRMPNAVALLGMVLVCVGGICTMVQKEKT